MVFAASFFSGVFVAAAYRLLRGRRVIPDRGEGNLVGAWLKILLIISVVTAGIWIFLTLLQRFPD